ncbi:uncharacterized protein LOC134228500 [Saccostrea cucullata]|uniref:uncharacterized protein LOC134228500 n=1 Tax=Saccostrea cuccullata TaxID=36930 RepID=UPI002ED30295
MDVRIAFLFTIVTLMKETPILCENSCEISVKSKKIVKSCPSNRTEMEESAKRLNCQKYLRINNCSDDPNNIYYHCVINESGNKTIEVCAPKITIFGHCTEFNEEAGYIQANYYLDCKNFKVTPCGKYYGSNEAYLYKECYNHTRNAQIFGATTPKTITTSQRPKMNEPIKQSLNEDVLESDTSSLVEVIAWGLLIMGVFLMVTFVFYFKLYRTADEVRKICKNSLPQKTTHVQQEPRSSQHSSPESAEASSLLQKDTTNHNGE